jgi:radical SAM superfamily enzyme YgiQ (UPF0313 family)
VLLISTYDLGRQPFGLASPAAWLRKLGAEVTCLDLAVEPLDELLVGDADLVAFFLPMHTATRLAIGHVARVRALAPWARIACYGLYAAMNEAFLRRLGVEYVLGGEFEAGLASLVERIASAAPRAVVPQIEPSVSLVRLPFEVPDRRGLPGLERYAHVHDRDGGIRTTGYVEASRGCKHRCRHCPVVPVYDGHFRVVPREVVLEDVRRQVAAGAMHVTFGDPDFWNGIGHAIPLVRALHAEHPRLTYDVTIKIEHLLRHREHLATLAETGCLFVTSAVESIDDRVLARLDKGHTRADFETAVALTREHGLTLNPTFVAFHPWITLEGYRELLATLERLDLVDHVAPIQLAIRLLIPAGSRLLELPEVQAIAGPFEEASLVHPWTHAVPEVDRLQREIQSHVAAEAHRASRRDLFEWAFERVETALSGRAPLRRERPARAAACVPYLTEAWYC